MELRIIKAALCDRTVCEQLIAAEINESISDVGALVLKEASAYYTRDKEALSVETDTLMGILEAKYSRKAEDFRDYLGTLPEDVSSLNVLEEITELRKQEVGFELANALLTDRHADAQELIEKYSQLAQSTARAHFEGSFMCDVDFTTLVEKEKSDIVLAPKCLNNVLEGGLIPGDNVLFFGPPEVGKSACLINAACGYLIQGQKILYVCNEDSPARMLPRFISRLTKRTKVEMMRDPRGTMELARERGYPLLTFVHMSPGTFPEIVAAVKKVQPYAVFIDQLRHVHVGKTEGKVTQLEKAGVSARNLAAEHNVVVINSAQGSAEAIGKAVLERKDVDSSKIGLPGAMDVMIGVGCDDVLEQHNQRILSVCKNKTGGGHKAIRVKINPMLSLITGET